MNRMTPPDPDPLSDVKISGSGENGSRTTRGRVQGALRDDLVERFFAF
jgi:hypothetical protein